MKNYYESNAAEYHTSTVQIDPSSFLEPLAQRLAPGATILDVGCGSGRDMRWFRERGFRPTGLEQSPTQSPTQSEDPVLRLLKTLQTRELASSQLRNALNVRHRQTFRQNYLHPALKAGFIEYTLPDKPNSRLQKYRLTDKGREMVKAARQPLTTEQTEL